MTKSERPAAETRSGPSLIGRAAWPAGVVVAALLGAVVGGLMVRGDGAKDGVETAGSIEDVVCRASRVADRVLPSVVTIAARGGAGSGTGTGLLIRDGGYLLTNEHVVSPAGEDGQLTIRYHDGTSSPATLVGADFSTDLAVLKADDGAEGRPLMTYGDSDALHVGQPVVALGAPLGLSSTVTAGIVSALGRYVPIPSQERGTAHLLDAIQTDAAINPGNSGGPLVNCAGELIGVNTAIATVPNSAGVSGGGSVGLGFSVPVAVVAPIAEQLIETGNANHPVIGLAAHAVGSAGSTQPDGLLVTKVVSGGPAAQAGLRAGDLITEVDGRPARDTEQLVLATLTRGAGDTLSLTFVRAGAEQSAEVTLVAP
ncbi:MAG: trypsin-like peptidase domain-containing protein [Nocardioides sp.]|uniref:S1C family serine protease n=1 Tax=Nocardioides sp. TaxID=35761 RepID=UPI0039E3DD9E